MKSSIPSGWLPPCCLACALLAMLGSANAEEASRKRAALALARNVVSEAADLAGRQWLRDKLWRAEDSDRYGLRLDDGWEQAAARSPDAALVVVIHGFNSTPAQNAGLLESIRDEGLPCGAFAYPNDRRLTESAQFLSQELKQFAAEHGAVAITLVAHSMGGLVARACLEDPALDPGNVDRLLMIAPPTHGSMIAHASFGADLWEHWLSRRDGGCWTRLRESVVDGLGEAADDLVPGSPFLARLNARPRNPRVRYAILLGSRSPVSERERKLLRWSVAKAAGRVEWLGNLTDEIDNVLADLDEVVDGKGDGVVAVKRGRLQGVDDVVVLPFSHLSCIDGSETAADRQLQSELLARLR